MATPSRKTASSGSLRDSIGQPNGIAPLDAAGLVPPEFLPQGYEDPVTPEERDLIAHALQETDTLDGGSF